MAGSSLEEPSFGIVRVSAVGGTLLGSGTFALVKIWAFALYSSVEGSS